MNIILISDTSIRTKNIKVTRTHIILITCVFFIITLMLAHGLNYFSQRYTDKINNPVLRSLVVSSQQKRNQDAQSHLLDNLDIMAVKLGQMQAKLLQLDALGERLAKSSGIKSQELLFNQAPGQGGALSTLPLETISFGEFNQKMKALSHALDDRADKLGVIDFMLRQDRLAKRVFPSIMPVDTEWFSSGFGYRIDPFTGKRAFHEGVDFAAKTGTPIKAAAGGVVIYSDRHPEYGNMIEIDHGDDLISRYAHASKRMVNLGQIVLHGQKIAEVGSTGRSTGPHLHFEIRHKDIPQNPSRFLKRLS
ncbi:MAG: M23 family metallopeptidase [Nitrosomonas sp.]|nr:M23 family metallopeptidase [Nitrosomonas sp.]MDP1949948.1 M23 family metallopeptidase [Nitrosomonas sp.]